MLVAVIVMSLRCFFLDVRERDSHFRTSCFFFVRSAAYHSLCCSQETTHWSVSSSQVLLRPVVVERALAGAGVAVLSSRLVELVEPWTKLGRDKNWVLRQGVSINGGTPKWMVYNGKFPLTWIKHVA